MDGAGPRMVGSIPCSREPSVLEWDAHRLWTATHPLCGHCGAEQNSMSWPQTAVTMRQTTKMNQLDHLVLLSLPNHF